MIPADLTASTLVSVQPSGPVVGRIRPPGSKSITNRALLCAALANSPSELSGVLHSEDTRVMIDALRALGAELVEDLEHKRITVQRGATGVDGEAPLELWVANSGTTIRFLAAALSVLGGHYRLDGVPRMRARPIEDLLQAIRQQGVECLSESHNGCPPVRIRGRGWPGGQVSVAGSVSSQFLSGLLMAAPRSRSPIQLVVHGELVSRPYVTMTRRVMERFGVTVTDSEADHFLISAPQPYRGTEFEIEPDASAASYHWAAAAITGGEVTVEGLSRNAWQGDVHFCDVLEQMGCNVTWQQDAVTVRGGKLRGIDVEMGAISDTVQTLAIVALFALGPTRIRGVGHNRFKETDRIGDLARELMRLGARVEEFPDGLEISPPQQLRPARIETYHDHRMAMSFALAGLRAPEIQITNPACTGKTYPEFFADLEGLTGRPHRWEHAAPKS